MNRLGILFIAGALILSALLTLMVYKHQKQKSLQNADQKNATVEILISTRSLNRGVVLKDTDIAWKAWPRFSVSPEFIQRTVRNKEDLIGSVIRKSISSGQPITDSMLISKDNQSQLAGILKPGMRAFTVDVSVAAALAGLLTPGDTVDVILTYNMNQSGGAAKEFVSKTIILGLNVLAVDQAITPIQQSDKANNKYASNSTNKNVTLEVTPKQAEILALSKSMGTLTLTLSSPDNKNNLVNLRDATSTDSSDLSNTTTTGDKTDVTLIRGDKIDQVGNGGS